MATQRNFEIKNGLNVAGTERISSAGAMTPQTLSVAAGAGIGGNLTVTGDLTVNGTTTTINSTALTIDDKTITLADGSASASAANGAGITIAGASANLTYDSTQDRWNMNKGLELIGQPLVVGSGSTDVGRLENSSGVLSLTAYTSRQIAFGNDTAGEAVRIDGSGIVNMQKSASVGGVSTNTQAHLSVAQEDTGNDTTSAINFHGTGNGSDGTTTTNLFRAVTNNANNWAHGKMFADGFTFTYGNTNTNRLKIENDGQIQIGSSNVGTDIVKFIGNTNIGPPNTANHTTGTRLNLYDSSSTAWYALGVDSNTMWLNSDMNYKFYVDAVEKVRIDGSDSPGSGEGTSYPVIQVGTAPSHMHGLGTVKVELPSSYPTSVKLMTAEPSEAVNIHGGTNSVGGWATLGSSLPNAFRGMTFLNTINTSQQADPVFYLSTAMEVILIRNSGWNAIAGGDFPLTTTGAGGNTMWQELSNSTTHGTFADILSVTVDKVYRAYLPAGRHKLDNDSGVYFFAGHNGGRIL